MDCHTLRGACQCQFTAHSYHAALRFCCHISAEIGGDQRIAGHCHCVHTDHSARCRCLISLGRKAARDHADVETVCIRRLVRNVERERNIVCRRKACLCHTVGNFLRGAHFLRLTAHVFRVLISIGSCGKVFKIHTVRRILHLEGTCSGVACAKPECEHHVGIARCRHHKLRIIIASASNALSSHIIGSRTGGSACGLGIRCHCRSIYHRRIYSIRIQQIICIERISCNSGICRHTCRLVICRSGPLCHVFRDGLVRTDMNRRCSLIDQIKIEYIRRIRR